MHTFLVFCHFWQSCAHPCPGPPGQQLSAAGEGDAVRHQHQVMGWRDMMPTVTVSSSFFQGSFGVIFTGLLMYFCTFSFSFLVSIGLQVQVASVIRDAFKAGYVFFVLVVSPGSKVVPLQLAVSEGPCPLGDGASRHHVPCVPRDRPGPGDPCVLGSARSTRSETVSAQKPAGTTSSKYLTPL